MKITIIGGGNLGCAIAQGLKVSKYSQPQHITITRRSPNAIRHMEEEGFCVSGDNHSAVKNAEVIILAVKPFQVKEVMEQMSVRPGQILISVVTGIWLRDLRQWCGEGVKVFRVMPNTAIAIRKSITCIAHDQEDPTAVSTVCTLFDALGTAFIIDEKLMDAATVIGACGIAFAMRFIRACIQGGIQIGFSAEQAALIVSQTVNGAAGLLLEHRSHPEQEIDKVTTPRGCTIAGLNEMEHHGFSSAVIKGLTASYDKIA